MTELEKPIVEKLVKIYTKPYTFLFYSPISPTPIHKRNRKLRPSPYEVLFRAAGKWEWLSVFPGDEFVFAAAVLFEELKLNSETWVIPDFQLENSGFLFLRNRIANC